MFKRVIQMLFLTVIYFCDWVDHCVIALVVEEGCGLKWLLFWLSLVFGGLAETVAEPSLQATQLKLKRARLADDLNEKIAQRPGPMELVEKNILPVDSSVKEAIVGENANYY